jgi:hypothetical protein
VALELPSTMLTGSSYHVFVIHANESAVDECRLATVQFDITSCLNELAIVIDLSHNVLVKVHGK